MLCRQCRCVAVVTVVVALPSSLVVLRLFDAVSVLVVVVALAVAVAVVVADVSAVAVAVAVAVYVVVVLFVFGLFGFFGVLVMWSCAY